MIKTILSLCAILVCANGCRVSNKFIFPTVEESYYLCGAVIKGTVQKKDFEDELGDNEIYLNNAEYFKGCGPSRVKITGYSSGTRCEIFPPRENKEVVVFVCKSKNADEWVLHKFASFAGQVSANRRHMRELTRISNQNTTCVTPQFKFGDCKSRNHQE